MILETSHNLLLVALSFFVAVFGSYTSLQLMRGIRTDDGKSKIGWIIGAAFALGGGAIWTMHFIGMIAYETSMEVGYDPLLTFASLLIAVVVVGLGIFMLSKNPKSVLVLLVAGVVTGLGVASMHYAGMEAMIMAADMSYEPTLFTISIVIAVVAATAALWLAFNLDGGWQMLLASIVMGIAVCGMHYTGMASMTMTMTMNHQEVAIESTIEPLTLGLFIFCFSMMLLVLSLIVTLSQLQKRMYEQLEDEDEDDAMDDAKPHPV